MSLLNRPSGRFLQAACLLAATALTGLAQDISAEARQQIADILSVKATFNAAEKKMSSSLAFAARLQRGGVPASVASMIQNIADANGMVAVVIDGSVPSGTVTGLGGTVTDVQSNNLSASVPLSSLGALANSLGVTAVREVEGKVFNRIPADAKLPSKKSSSQFPGLDTSKIRLASEQLPVTVRPQHTQQPYFMPMLAANGKLPSLGSWLRPDGMAFFIGSLTSQGYISHQAQQVINMGINGSGVKVGVLSDSASAARVAALIASGDLPANTVVLPGQASSGTDEGTAMMEIVSDMAPGAQIYFATANPTQAAFAANILALRAAGCDIIVDDVTYFAEGIFQDGTVAKAVNTVVASGAMYFSSAGNSGGVTKGTSGTWEGDFNSGGAVTGPIATLGETGIFHNFASSGTQNYNVLVGASNIISLKWSDPLGASTNDYDIFLLNAAGSSVIAFSAGVQNGTQDPFELFRQTNAYPANSRIAVVLFSGAPRALHLDTNRGRVSIATTGATGGHNAAASAITAAATFWNSARTGTRPFTGFANTVETFSSDGPRKVFFDPTGTAITAGNVLFATNGGTTLQKPDLTAADGTTAKTTGFSPFYGTSASAPHLAGIAALIKSARPTLTNAQIRQIMISTALDNMAVGWDRDGGYGIPMALPAVQAALALP